jgi:PAS domain S-box-containing protein
VDSFRTARDIVDAIGKIEATLSELRKTIGVRMSMARRLEEFVRSTTDWIWETDSNHNYTYVSEGVAAVLGVSSQGLIGQHLFSLSFVRSTDEGLYRLVTTMNEYRSFRDHPIVLTDRLGGSHEVALSGAPIRDDVTGRFSGYTGSGIVRQSSAARWRQSGGSRLRSRVRRRKIEPTQENSALAGTERDMRS